MANFLSTNVLVMVMNSLSAYMVKTYLSLREGTRDRGDLKPEIAALRLRSGQANQVRKDLQD